MMKAAVVHALGEPPRCETFEEPAVGPGESLVHVSAAAIKQLDRAIVRGTHYGSPRRLPVVCGTDGVGRLDDGSRVYFASMRPPFGSMAERSAATLTVPVPEKVGDVTAAALVNPALGAWLPLSWRAKMTAGETVLVVGATGATGRLAVTIARILGAGRIIAAGRNIARLADCGADILIDTEQKPDALKRAFADAAGPNGYDVIIDYLWGSAAEALIDVLTGGDLHVSGTGTERGIRYVSVGALAGPSIALSSAVLRSSHLQILGSGTGNFPPADLLKETVARILLEAAKGNLGVTSETAELSKVTEVWDLGSASRRIVLLPPSR